MGGGSEGTAEVWESHVPSILAIVVTELDKQTEVKTRLKVEAGICFDFASIRCTTTSILHPQHYFLAVSAVSRL